MSDLQVVVKFWGFFCFVFFLARFMVSLCLLQGTCYLSQIRWLRMTTTLFTVVKKIKKYRTKTHSQLQGGKETDGESKKQTDLATLLSVCHCHVESKKMFIEKMNLIRKRQLVPNWDVRNRKKKKPAELLILSQGLKNHGSSECLVIWG